MKIWLMQHGRAMRTTAGKLVRTPFASAFNVIVLGIALALPCGLYVALTNVQHAVRAVSPDPQLTLFLAPDASPSDAEKIDAQLKKHAQVARRSYVPRERALEDLKRASGMSGIVEALERNPLPNAFVINANNPTPVIMERLRRELSGWPKVDHVQLDAEWTQRLDAALKVGRIALSVLAMVLGFSLVAITFNTIRLQILTQREEIEVTALIGAANGYIRRPFLYYGAVLGVLGGLAASGFVWAAIAALNAPITDLSLLYGARWEITPMNLQDAASVLAFAGGLGWLGAWLSVARHLMQVRRG
ncbi:MAG: permease-like cell division protein FtsX [Pseudomonadota bacterium]